MVIGSTDITWEQVVEIVNTNQLAKLYRDQATMDHYRAFKAECIAEGLSVVQFIIKNRLGWTDENGYIDIKPNTTDELFTDASDAKIIANDFPYKFSSDITHLVAWTKLEIPSDPASDIGDVSSHTRAVIDAYVNKTFVRGLNIPQSNVIWFRNFPSLQSVAELSHTHVLLKDMSDEQLQKVLGTSGEVLTEEEVATITAHDSN